jgi:hypothetical protein
MYKLSGTNNICKRGKWEDNEGDEAENQSPIGHVEWIELQVNDLEPNGEVSCGATIDAGG